MERKPRGPGKGRTEYTRTWQNVLRQRQGLPPLPPLPRPVKDYRAIIKSKIIIDATTGCWVWQGSKNNLGYGFIRYQGKSNKLVHRVAYQEFVGPIPEGLNVLHRCDNPPCCNPDHLFTGSQKDNVADMMAKGRHYYRGIPRDAIRYAEIRAAISKRHKGARLYNNGIRHIVVAAGDKPPKGYVLGRNPDVAGGGRRGQTHKHRAK